jgi:hypothetical protein
VAILVALAVVALQIKDIQAGRFPHQTMAAVAAAAQEQLELAHQVTQVDMAVMDFRHQLLGLL